MKYLVRIYETHSKSVIVDAATESDAIDKARNLYYENKPFIADGNSTFLEADFETYGLAYDDDIQAFEEY